MVSLNWLEFAGVCAIGTFLFLLVFLIIETSKEMLSDCNKQSKNSKHKLKNMFGSHDITHCMKSSCPKASTCHRYLMYEDAVEKEIQYITIISPEFQEQNPDCDLYWEERDNG